MKTSTLYYENASDDEKKFLESYDPSKFPIFTLTVDLVVTHQRIMDSKTHGTFVLLIKRKGYPYKDHWALPGGFIDPSETTRQAALRELHEEAGLTILKSIDLLTVADRPDRDPRGRVVSTVYRADLGWRTKAPEVYAGDDALDAKWFPLSVALRGLGKPLAFDHNEILERL